MSKKDTHYTILQRIVKNTNTKGQILNKSLYVSADEYNNLLQYIRDNAIVQTLNIEEIVYKTKTGHTKAKIKFLITDKQGNILNISHILYLLYKKYMPVIKLNIKHNYIIGELNTSAEVYARISNYYYSKYKISLKTLHQIIPFTE